MRSAKGFSVSFPAELREEVTEIAKDERRSISEVLREAFRQYKARRVVEQARRAGQRYLKKKGKPLTDDDIDRIVHEGRK
jgi:Arc/MetJ-type ribon-helix-helix transcriptional regulator